MSNWFDNIQKPIIGLAPMHGYTFSEFRKRCRKAGADVVYSEMVASEAIIRRVPKALEMLHFDKNERPVVLQIFGRDPLVMTKVAKIIEDEFMPDGIDINFGCPVQKAAKQGFGSFQLKDPQKAAQIVTAVSGATKLPVSVKMRLPSTRLEDTIDFIKKIRGAGAQLVTIHPRTMTQKYRGHADWNFLRKVKENFPDFPILGSGDIDSLQSLKDNLGDLDGVLIGRAAKRDPSIFSELQQIKYK